MNDHENQLNANSQLHLHGDPETERMESLIDQLAEQDRQSMPAGASARLLEAVSEVCAPEPISIQRAEAPIGSGRGGITWKIRVAAAMLLATGTTLTIVISQPWSSGQSTPSTASSWSLASFEQDFDAYLTLDEIGDEQLSDAMTEWELWAQSVDTEIDSGMYNDDWDTAQPSDGAL